MTAPFRNTFEAAIAAQIALAYHGKKGFIDGLALYYERYVLTYGMGKTYCPDFVLPNGILVEAKGAFMPETRNKHRAIRKEYPALDIRFVFQNAAAKLGKATGKRLKGNCVSWCRKYGFQYAEGDIPKAWILEPVTETRAKGLECLRKRS